MLKHSALIRIRCKTYLGETLLLQVGNNALTDQIGRADNVQYLVIILAHEREFESVLCRVNRDRTRFGIAVEAVHDLALDASQVHWLLERFDDAVVTLRQCVLDVVQRRVDQDAAVIPGTRLDPDRFMDHGTLTERLVGNHDGWGYTGAGVEHVATWA